MASPSRGQQPLGLMQQSETCSQNLLWHFGLWKPPVGSKPSAAPSNILLHHIDGCTITQMVCKHSVAPQDVVATA